jgi:hypothetical protein
MRKTYIQQYLSQHACITIVQFGMVSFTWRPFVWTYSDPLAQGYSIYPILDRNGVISNHRNLHTIFLRGCDVEKDVAYRICSLVHVSPQFDFESQTP